ncbi:MAG: chitobiase/beta-hexosaminidase C-terminal domain-containing protein, partial [Atopobiaceae bacterium]|nr:chitobiase/beta-hexosaminidase C-terminal domain-containing protein [Atopobiaceae bacterium]
MDITRRAWSIGFLSIGAVSVAVLSSCAGQDGRSPSGSGSGADHGPDEGPAPDTVVFRREAGAYPDDPLELVLENPSGYDVAYTTDGSIPTAESPLADGPILLDSSDTNAALIPALDAEQYDQSKSVIVDPTLPTATLIRASAVLPDGSMGPVNTSIFFVGEDLPALFGDAMVISLAIDPESLFDYETGIMALGAIYDEHLEENKRVMEEGHSWDTQANCTQKGRDWEREAHVEVFDCANSVSAEGPCGLRLRG